MDNKEALKVIEKLCENLKPTETVVLSAFLLACVALERQIPKKIKIIDGYDFCPTCSYKFGSDTFRRMLHHWDQPFCKRCGQRLDWEVNDAEIH